MTSLQLGPSFTVDANIATRRTGLIGQPDTGKTNGLVRFDEELLDLAVPVLAWDWKGDLWGLRSSADGTKDGFPVVIFGGEHADVAITEGDGREIGHLIAKERMPAIIDLSGLESDAARRRFATAGLRAFLQAKAPAAMHVPHLVCFDEFQQFAPQKPHGNEPDLLHEVEQHFGLGRKRGIGILWTTLRLAQVAKSCTELTDVYLFMQTAGRNDLKALEDTIKRYAADEEIKEIMSTVPRLGKGEVLVYSPSWMQKLERHKFSLRKTFDSSRTPEIGGFIVDHPTKFAKINAPALEAQIAATREKREADDPETLRARIVQLEYELGQLPEMIRQQTITKEVPVPVFDEVHRKLLSDAALTLRALRENQTRLATAMESMGNLLTRVGESFTSLEDQIKLVDEAAQSRTAQDGAHDGAISVPKSTRVEQSNTEKTSRGPDRLALPRPQVDGEMGAAATAVLLAVGSYAIGKATRKQIAALTGYSVRKSTLRNALSALRTRGLIESEGEDVILTAAGRKASGPPPAPKTRAEKIELWRGKLKEAAPVALFDVLLQFPKGLDRDELGTRAGVNPGKSTLRNALSKLRTQGLIIEERNSVRLTDELL